MSKLRSIDKLFEGRHFDREVIVLCVSRYVRCKLSLRDVVEMMPERGLSLAHTTTNGPVRRESFTSFTHPLRDSGCSNARR
jgi:transposase-like protein